MWHNVAISEDYSMRFVKSLLLILLFVVSNMALAQDAEPGSDGAGDEYYPLAGNGGYDALHYLLNLNVDVDENFLDAVTTIQARATQDLSAFNLDFADDLEISELTVRGVAADFTQEGAELTVTPANMILEGEEFNIVVHYSGNPNGEDGGQGWQYDDANDAIFVFGEPFGAESWFPVNGHPTDKARYTVRVTVPVPFTAVSNGLLQSQIDNGDTTTFNWQAQFPMASYLVVLHIARLELVEGESESGVPIRNYFPVGMSSRAQDEFSRQGEMIDCFEEFYGPYPFEVYGATVVEAKFGSALETQTMSIFGAQAADEGVAAHELSHQWFGDSLSVARWQDIWLNEGFATFSEGLWLECSRGTEARDRNIGGLYRIQAEEEQLFADLDELRNDNTANGQDAFDYLDEQFGPLDPDAFLELVGLPSMASLRFMTAGELLDLLPFLAPVVLADPGPDNIFSGTVYGRGGLTLHALRFELGDDTFFDIIRTYTERYRYSNVTTEDFIAVAEEISGEDLTDFFDAWLYQTDLPPIEALDLGTD
jgi:aminopeptidase N